MRKQIAAANWKMNCTLQEAQALLQGIKDHMPALGDGQEVIVAVPYPYLMLALEKLQGNAHVFVAAQNVHHLKSGAYTGEVSAPILSSLGLNYCIIGHSERREQFGETNALLAQKTDILLANGIAPVFCCGEPLAIRESETQNAYVETQLRESLFHLSAAQITGFVIAYEPIWAIGTGKTASSAQAQDMHAHIRQVLAAQYGAEVANTISILYGGSVKADNAAELFGMPDVDGGLVGGASLVAADFGKIMASLKA